MIAVSDLWPVLFARTIFYSIVQSFYKGIFTEYIFLIPDIKLDLNSSSACEQPADFLGLGSLSS